MAGRLLFDASSIIYLMKLRNLGLACDNYIQWLTVYEVINALWKEAALFKSLSTREAGKLVEIFAKMVDFMKLLSPRPYEREILEVAGKLKMTAYDASYVVLAKHYGLRLVSEDGELRRKAGNVVKALSVDELL